MRQQVCVERTPDLREIAPGHFSRCHFDGVDQGLVAQSAELQEAIAAPSLAT
jgi:hypothetical protein